MIGLILLLGVMMFLSPTQSVASEDFTEFTNSYIISGSVKLPNTPSVRVSGGLKLIAVDQGNLINYTHEYHASAVGLGTENDQFYISEDKINKTLDLSTNTNTSIAVIFDLFSNFGENEIQSFYRITNDEIEDDQVSILNVTVPLEDETIYYSSELEQDIPVNKLVIPLDYGYNITAFYDTKYNLMMGFEITFKDLRVQEGAIWKIRFAISETSLDLSYIKQFPYVLVTGIAAGSIILSTAGYLLYRKFSTPVVLDGGMN